MALKKRLRRYPAVPSRKPSAITPGVVDTWLQRISHISQLGLFLFTVGAIYFTVIPLYQKALLDEQIAQKEIKLEQLQKSLDLAYSKIRSSVVGDYIFHAGAECSGVLLPIDLPRARPNSPAKGQSHAERVLEIAPEDCLSNELNTEPLKELKAQDLALLHAEVSRIGIALEKSRQIAVTRFSRAEETAKSKPHSIPSKGFTGAIAEYVLKGQSPQFQEKILAQIAMDGERSDAASQYGDEVRSELLTLRSIKWPVDKGSDL